VAEDFLNQLDACTDRADTTGQNGFKRHEAYSTTVIDTGGCSILLQIASASSDGEPIETSVKAPNEFLQKFCIHTAVKGSNFEFFSLSEDPSSSTAGLTQISKEAQKEENYGFLFSRTRSHKAKTEQTWTSTKPGKYSIKRNPAGVPNSHRWI
jgi:hypothetical protein